MLLESDLGGEFSVGTLGALESHVKAIVSEELCAYLCFVGAKVIDGPSRSGDLIATT